MSQAILLDLDKTILDTIRFYDNYFDTVEQLYGKDKLAIFKQVCDETYSLQGTARLDLAIESIGGDINLVAKNLNNDYLFPDAKEFINNNQNLFILSMGEAKSQGLKMKVSGLDIPILLVTQHRKAKWIKENLLVGKKYLINGKKFDSIIFCDDREENFVGFDALTNAKGYIINRYNKKHNNLPINVSEIISLSEITE